MAEDIEGAGEAAKPEAAKPNTDAKNELPEVEAPSLSPAADAPESVPEQAPRCSSCRPPPRPAPSRARKTHGGTSQPSAAIGNRRRSPLRS